MNPTPLVSVVIPTRDREAMLREAIDSIRGQRFRDWELIVIDDGSRDDIRGAVARFADSRIRHHRQERAGVSAARNFGIRLARAPWLAFLDSDDLWKPDKLHRQLEALEAEPAYHVCHSEEIWIRDGRRVNPKKIHRKRGGWIFEHCLPRCVVSPSSVLLHRRVFQRHGTFDERFPVCEDYELWLRLASRLPFLFVPEPLVVKRGGHADQLSRSLWGMDRFRVRALLKTLAAPSLPPRLAALTTGELVRKAEILAIGCRKRGRRHQAAHYASLAERWRPAASGSPPPASAIFEPCTS